MQGTATVVLQIAGFLVYIYPTPKVWVAHEFRYQLAGQLVAHFPMAREHDLGTGVTPEYGRFFRGPNCAVLPEPTDEANRCSLGHETPNRLQKALYVGFSQIGWPLQVV
jgi:hypothetical protein